MPKISALPPAGTLADDDETPFVDDSVGSTKKFTLAGLLVWLQSKAAWIATAMVADDAITGAKLSLDTAELEATSAFTTSSTSFVDTGLKVTLPAAGTWLILPVTRFDTLASNQYGVTRLYNQTTAAAIASTELITVFSNSGAVQSNTSNIKVVTTTTANNIIRVEIKSGGAWSVGMSADSNGKSRLLAIRIG